MNSNEVISKDELFAKMMVYIPQKMNPDTYQYEITVEDAKALVCQYAVLHGKDYTAGLLLENENVHVVWWTYILGGWKCMLCTDLPDGMYYEVTYNHTKNEIYLDAYKHEKNLEYAVKKWIND